MVALLTGCGGGGGGDGSTGTNVASKGAITSLGSITVNGVTYGTKNAILRLPDENIIRSLPDENAINNEGLLKQGMVVTVKGVAYSDGKTVAREIEYMDNLEGKITSKSDNSMVVMGQTVVVEDTARAVFDTLAPGNIVEVSGVYDVQGNIRATYLAKKPDRTGDYELKGFIYSIHGPSSFTLVTGVLQCAPKFYTVNVDSTSSLVLGSTAEVISDSDPVGTVITAKRVNLNVKNELGPTMGDKIEIEGYVYNPRLQFDSFNLIVDFEAPLIMTTQSTVIVGGTKADIVEGRKMEVEADIVANSPGMSWSLIATKIILK